MPFCRIIFFFLQNTITTPNDTRLDNSKKGKIWLFTILAQGWVVSFVCASLGSDVCCVVKSQCHTLKHDFLFLSASFPFAVSCVDATRQLTIGPIITTSSLNQQRLVLHTFSHPTCAFLGLSTQITLLGFSFNIEPHIRLIQVKKAYTISLWILHGPSH